MQTVVITGPVRLWLNEIQDAKKREKHFRKEGQRIVEIYSGRKKETIPFNILYSNTETLLPALYGNTPKPIVQRRYKDNDPTGKDASTVAQRTLEFLLDTNVEGYETFDTAMRNAALDGLLPGRGVTRIKFEAEITDVEGDQTTQEAEGDADATELETTPVKTYEMVCTETVEWDRVLFGYAKRWSKMPWIAFEHYLDKGECKRLFGAKANKLQFSSGAKKSGGDDDNEGASGDDNDENQGERKTTLIYEIWDKKKKRVYFISPKFPEFLKDEEDPLELTGFYPIPKPLTFLAKSSDLVPTALYELYENQAHELNKISVRINRIVDAIKVRGAYDGSLGDTLNTLLKGDDNTLIATDNASNMALEGGLEKYIWLMPLEKLIQVLAQLILARNECKQIIYEVTGIADVLRGATDANETLGAQQLKSQWASQRLKSQQNEVRRYVREVLRIMIEIAAKKFDPETFAAMTGLPFVMRAEKEQARQALAMQAQQFQMQAMQAQAMGQQVQPPQPDPQLLQTAQSQDWESVLELLRNDMERSYRIDIETNSTIQVNEQEDKENITEALGAIGQFLTGVSPLVEQGMMDFEVAKSMLLTIVRRFQFGTEIEDQIKTMKPPQPKPDPKAQAEAQKMQIEQQKQQAENARMERQAQIDMQTAAAEAQRQERQAVMDAEKERMEMEFARQEHAMKMAELSATQEFNLLMAELKRQELQDKITAQKAQAQIAQQQARNRPKEKA